MSKAIYMIIPMIWMFILAFPHSSSAETTNPPVSVTPNTSAPNENTVNPPPILYRQDNPGNPNRFLLGKCTYDVLAILKLMAKDPNNFDMTKIKVLSLIDVVVSTATFSQHVVVYHEDGYIYDPSLDGYDKANPITVEPIPVRTYFQRAQPAFVRQIEQNAYRTYPGFWVTFSYPRKRGDPPEWVPSTDAGPSLRYEDFIMELPLK